LTTPGIGSPASQAIVRTTVDDAPGIFSGHTPVYPDLRQGSSNRPSGRLFASLVRTRWNVAPKVHSVVEYARDFDRSPRRGPVHQEVTSTTNVLRNVEGAKARHDLVSSLRARDVGTFGELANRMEKRIPVDTRLPSAKSLGGPFEDICKIELRGGA